MKALSPRVTGLIVFRGGFGLRGERNMSDAVIQISTGGRGFIVGARERFVVTASHCLPRLPAPDPGAYLAQRTFEALLGPLGAACEVWAECVYVDPVADLAVLAAPDAQHFASEAKNYALLVAERTPLRIAALPLTRDGKARMTEADAWEGPGRLLSLDGQWFECRLRATRRSLWIGDKAQAFAGGMSGSPVADADGAALGVLCTTAANPILVQHLPRWLLDEIGVPLRDNENGA